MRPAIEYVAWADDAFLQQLADHPEAALTAPCLEGTWTVGGLVLHILGGAEWYQYCLAKAMWSEFTPPTTHAELATVRARLAEVNATLVAQADLPDEVVEFDDENGPRSALRSVLLTQAIVHSVEHRAHIVMGLEAAGYRGIDLDHLSAWGFQAHLREQG